MILNTTVAHQTKFFGLSGRLFETCGYFFPRLMFLQSRYGANTQWGDVVQALNNFPEDALDISSELFWQHWKDRWSALGDKYLLDANNSRTLAGKNQLTLSAAACYHWSEFMYFSDKKVKIQLRKKARDCFWSSFTEHPYIVYSDIIYCCNTLVPYYLVLPAGSSVTSQQYPCVILSNGLDSMTEIEIFNLCEQFLLRGIAVLLFDGPGQGVNSGITPLTLNFEIVVTELLSVLSKNRKINFDALGFFGVSFGGYLALRIAHQMGDYFRCIVNLSGGPYLTPYNQMKRRLKQDFQFALCCDNDNVMGELIDGMNQLSGFTTNSKILSIHGLHDDIFPVAGLRQLEAILGDRHQLVLYRNESHVCLNRINQYSVILADWVAGELLDLVN